MKNYIYSENKEKIYLLVTSAQYKDVQSEIQI